MPAYHDIQPGHKPAKVAVIRAAMFVMGRAWQAVGRFDQRLQQEVAEWPAGFRIMLKVRPNGPQWDMFKGADSRVYYGGSQGREEDADLVIHFKNVESAFLVFTLQIGTHQAYAERRMTVKGDLRYSLALMRGINIVETYLFPYWLARQLLKRPVDIPATQKHAYRLWMFLVGIPFGL